MKNKYKTIIKILLVFFLVILIIEFGSKWFLQSFGNPSNGRNYTITFPEMGTIQADPPTNKLIRFMNDKYGVTFRRYRGEEYLIDKNEIDHINSKNFTEYFNGILVETDEYPGHYFYVCDYYGTYLDDYYFHIQQGTVEQYFYKKINSVVDSEFKVVCHPKYKQRYAVNFFSDSSDYINHCNYDFRIYICDDGKKADEDLEAISSVLSPYLNESYRWLNLYYVDSVQFNSIDSSDYMSYAGDDVIYIKYGRGRMLFDNNEQPWDWDWIE